MLRQKITPCITAQPEFSGTLPTVPGLWHIVYHMSNNQIVRLAIINNIVLLSYRYNFLLGLQKYLEMVYNE